MTKEQAYMALSYSTASASLHADVIMAAHSKYFVRKQDGRILLDRHGKPIETDDLSFALAAAYNSSGSVVDRWNWRNN